MISTIRKKTYDKVLEAVMEIAAEIASSRECDDVLVEHIIRGIADGVGEAAMTSAIHLTDLVEDTLDNIGGERKRRLRINLVRQACIDDVYENAITACRKLATDDLLAKEKITDDEIVTGVAMMYGITAGQSDKVRREMFAAIRNRRNQVAAMTPKGDD